MAGKSTLTYRDYQPGDESKILDLFREVFHRKMNPAFWRWRYEKCPYGHGMMHVAMDGDKMVGHFGVIPMRIQFQGKTYPAIFPMTAMTLPEYAGQGIFTRLMSETYESSRKQGYPLVYGFFNQNSYYANVKFGYHNVIKVDPLEKKLSTYDLNENPDQNVVVFDRFDVSFDHLWNMVKDEYVAIVPRTSEYLNWRFVQAPDVKYIRYAYQDRDNVLGYIVLKIYTEGITVRGHIIDILTVPDEKIARALIVKGLDFFQTNRVPEVTAWVKDNTLYSRILENEGFIRKSGLTNFAVMVLEKGMTDLLPAEKAEDWFLTMGDSDVF